MPKCTICVISMQEFDDLFLYSLELPQDGDFKALSYQVTNTTDTGCVSLISTIQAINYTECWQLGLVFNYPNYWLFINTK